MSLLRDTKVPVINYIHFYMTFQTFTKHIKHAKSLCSSVSPCTKCDQRYLTLKSNTSCPFASPPIRLYQYPINMWSILCSLQLHRLARNGGNIWTGRVGTKYFLTIVRLLPFKTCLAYVCLARVCMCVTNPFTYTEPPSEPKSNRRKVF